jgi:transposase
MAHNGSSRASFVAAVAAGASVNDAAARIGVSRRTATRWHNDPTTRGQIDSLSRATLVHARDRLLELVDEATDTLAAVMTDKSAGASARVSAARCVLSTLVPLNEATEMAHRLSEVEAILAARKRWTE